MQRQPRKKCLEMRIAALLLRKYAGCRKLVGKTARDSSKAALSTTNSGTKKLLQGTFVSVHIKIFQLGEGKPAFELWSLWTVWLRLLLLLSLFGTGFPPSFMALNNDLHGILSRHELLTKPELVQGFTICYLVCSPPFPDLVQGSR
mmetsp:Transcript_159285/g.293566  ORF Transcript_159285/g.293566 Transcript_159285/m.293566 type:complete len:146 (-) Transcript_159285:1100-1537(-)